MSGPDRAVTPERVAAACAAWAWYPDDATTVETDDFLLVRWPAYVGVALSTTAFGEGTLPGDATITRLAASARADLEEGRGGTVVVYAGGRPVGTGGLGLVDDVARLWGGAVLPDARGRGAYRAALDVRLREARDRGATLALVKGRVETSGPVLRRAGFTVFGQERVYRLPVGAGAAS